MIPRLDRELRDALLDELADLAERLAGDPQVGRQVLGAALLHEHAGEHAALVAALDAPDAAALAANVPRLAAELREHMAEEERTFLAADD